MITGIILSAVALVVLLIATYTDFKTGEVPDWLSFSFIISALGVRLIHSLVYSDWLYFLYGLIGFGVMYGFGLLIYYSRQWGGGDAKILMGLGAAFATAPFAYSGNFPYLLAIVANIFIAGGVYGLLWGFYVFFSRFSKTTKAVQDNLLRNKKQYMLMLAVSIAVLVSSFFFKGSSRIILMFIPILFIAYMMLYLFIKSTESAGMYEKVSVSKLTEGDWIANDVRVKGKLICSKKDPGITKEQIKALKKAKIKSVVIKKGIKFLLALLVGTAVTLIFNNIVVLLFL
ncbi:MAG: A24 family peptidase [Nanoarchaeota archaeon]|nr:A24 family peptidase [Nanoarchaeota archaeon]